MLILDSSHSEPLIVEGLHYAELEDVMTLPFPLSVRQQFEEMQRKKNAKRRDDFSDSSDSDSDDDLPPRRGGSSRSKPPTSRSGGPGDRGSSSSSSSGGSRIHSRESVRDDRHDRDERDGGSASSPGRRRKIAAKFTSLPYKRGQKAESVYEKMFSKDK